MGIVEKVILIALSCAFDYDDEKPFWKKLKKKKEREPKNEKDAKNFLEKVSPRAFFSLVHN